MEKKCNKCKEVKSLVLFSKKTKNKDGLQHVCKSCQTEYGKSHYQDNKEEHKAAMIARRKRIAEENRLKLFEFYSTHPCVDCGHTNPLALECDHVRGEKRMAVSELVKGGYGWKTVLEEIAKCEVRCASCHRIRTGLVQGWYKGLIQEHHLTIQPR